MRNQPLTLGTLATATTLMLASAAAADLRVTFIEGAPKDQFRIENTSACAIVGGSVMIELSPSQGGLIFDVTAAGQGVEVFQPFEITQGAAALIGAPTVSDGQTNVELKLKTLAPNGTIAFTIDVDDTIGQRAITVSGAEIQGAIAQYIHGAKTVSATLSSTAQATLQTPKC